jgi:pimeloyl-ACP methyl ester carboxylesterase
MPFAMHRGQRIHYEVDGEGPVVLFQHGFLQSAGVWDELGYTAAFTDSYRVVRVDSLGHGMSDKPSDPTLYGWEQRASDLVAVLDDLDAQSGHLVGYSMGGWIVAGVAQFQPDRLASLVIGGFDPRDGVAAFVDAFESNGLDFSFEVFVAAGKAADPTLTDWITPAFEPGLRACFEVPLDFGGAVEAITDLKCPVLLWDGTEDVYHARMQNVAASAELPFLSVAGDHLGTLGGPGRAASLSGLRAFIDAAARTAEAVALTARVRTASCESPKQIEAE